MWGRFGGLGLRHASLTQARLSPMAMPRTSSLVRAPIRSFLPVFAPSSGRPFSLTSLRFEQVSPPGIPGGAQDAPKNHIVYSMNEREVVLDQKYYRRARKPSKHRFVRWFQRHPILCTLLISPFLMAASLTVLLLGVLIHDSTTYDNETLNGLKVPINPIALNPRRGGKKNLPIAEFQIDDSEDPEQIRLSCKEKLVIVGGGWGSVGVLKHLNPGDYHVTVVAPENYFLFQPLLPSATVGTVEFRSIVEPIRKIMAHVRGHFLKAYAVDVDFDNKLLEVRSTSSNDTFYVPYDRLIVACGSVNATHGVPGLDKAYQLKTINDALVLRRKIHQNLEQAALPSTSPQERERLLSFVISGGGPTGVEFASELLDFVNEDVMKFMPKALRQAVNVTVIQSRDHILNTYSEIISDFAEKKFKDSGISVITNARVDAITDKSVIYHSKDDGISREIPSGLSLWSTGIAKNAFADKIAEYIPGQMHRRALLVDNHLRVIGTAAGSVYALGDCATVATRLVSKMDKYIDAVTGSPHTDVLTHAQAIQLQQKILRRYPALGSEFSRSVKKLLNSSGKPWVTKDEFVDMVNQLTTSLTSYPATAQVANQQGSYLGRKLHRLARARDLNIKESVNENDIDETIFHAFVYRHLGSLAYVGNSAVFSLDNKSGLAGGLVAMYLWRSIYWSEQVSFRNRALVLFDWVKRGIWGRDFSTF